MESPTGNPIKDGNPSLTLEASMQDIAKRIDQFRDMVHAGLSIPDTALKNLHDAVVALHAQVRKTDADLKRLQKIVAGLYDETEQLKSKVSARHDVLRTERTWTEETAAPPTGAASSAHAPAFGYQERLMKMLTTQGQLKRPQKTMMLGNWITKVGCRERSVERLLMVTRDFLQNLLQVFEPDTDSDDAEELVNVREFLEKPWEELIELNADEAFHFVISSIPKNEWLEFVRSALKMKESEIEDFKRQCTPTREQFFQLNKAYDEWIRGNN